MTRIDTEVWLSVALPILVAVSLFVPDAVLGTGSPSATQPHPASRPALRRNRVRVAGIVLKWVTADKQANLRRIVPLIRQAAAQGAELVVTTECFLDGYAIRDKKIPIDQWRALAEPIPGGSYLTRLCELSAELKIHLVAGMLEGSGEQTFNTAVLIGPDGRVLGKYRKHRLEHELVRNTPGDTAPVFDTALGRIGLLICADRREPDLIRRLASGAPDLLVCPSGGMWGPVKNDHYLQARSRENRVPIVFVHPVEFLLTSPDGAILERRFAGQLMDVSADQAGGPEDTYLIVVREVEFPGS